MAITPLPHSNPAGPAGVVEAACAGIDAIADALWSARAGEELVAGVEAIQVLKAKTAALEASLLAEVAVRDIARTELAWASTADWYTHLAGTIRRHGKRTVEQATILVGERRETLGALASGDVSPEQAQVVVEAVERLPHADHVRRRGERFLLTEAGRLNATDLTRAGRHLLRVVDPEGEDRRAEKELDREERAAHLDRHLSLSDDGLGGVRIKGRGSVEDGAALRAALLPLTKPTPSLDPVTCEESPDPRDHGARTWDALIQLAQHSLDTDLAPNSHGARPRVAVTISAEDLAEGSTSNGVTEDGLDLSASAVRRMACDADLIRVLLDAEGCARRRPHPPAGHPRDLDFTHRPRPALRLPRLQQAACDVPRPSHCALGRRRRDVAGQPRVAVWSPPSHRPPHALAGPARRGPPAGVPPTAQGRTASP